MCVCVFLPFLFPIFFILFFFNRFSAQFREINGDTDTASMRGIKLLHRIFGCFLLNYADGMYQADACINVHKASGSNNIKNVRVRAKSEQCWYCSPPTNQYYTRTTQ